ncbi:hypothetical protein [Fluviicola sp.]|uniref:hypothetical protein n=1 Tax=Fluviicola sp. TaxID=1917219 RepID=UPI003D2E31AC
MKKLIHIDNYESFYLDYLEGTLSEAERIAFEEFLVAHPELQVDEELVFLDDAPEKMDPLEKLLLKKEEVTSVTNENLDYFAIGKIEHALSKEEEKVFDGYLGSHPEAQKVVAAYGETRLEPVVVAYPNKEDLKEKEIAFVSWKLIVGIASAAAVVLLFFQLGFNSSDPQKDPSVFANHTKTNQKTHPKDKKLPEVDPSTQPIEENNTFVAQKNTAIGAPNPKKDRNKNQKGKGQEEQIIPIQPEPEKNQVADNKPHQPTILPPIKNDKQPVSPTLDEEVNKAPHNDLASNAGGSNMKNPIPLITNTISEKTKTPVDFKTGKATETEKGGFFLRIGKFEVSHKASKRK